MYCEVTLSKFDGTRIKKYWVSAENVYERNKIISNLIFEFRKVFEETPKIDVFEIKTAYNAYADYILPHGRI